MKSINPATGEEIASYPEHTAEEVEALLARARGAATRWRDVPMGERAAALSRLGDALEASAEERGALMTAEMGKPIGQAVGEAKKCAWVCRYYAEHGPRMLQERHVQAAAGRSVVRFDPLGVVLSIMPSPSKTHAPAARTTIRISLPRCHPSSSPRPRTSKGASSP